MMTFYACKYIYTHIIEKKNINYNSNNNMKAEL